MKISIVVAVSQNQVIGSQGTLPWRLSSDLKKFKKITSGHTIIMGRKTYESIGRPLPNRTNILITRNPIYQAEGCYVVHSLEESLNLAQNQQASEVFIIGGGEIYQQALPQVDKIYLSRVNTQLEGDTFFPPLDTQEWKTIHQEAFLADDKNEYDFNFIELERIFPLIK